MYCTIRVLYHTCTVPYMYCTIHVLHHTCTLSYMYCTIHVLHHTVHLCIPEAFKYQSKYIESVGVLPIWIIKSNISSVGPSSESNKLDFTIRIGSTPTFLYFNLYLYDCLLLYIFFINSGTSNSFGG